MLKSSHPDSFPKISIPMFGYWKSDFGNRASWELSTSFWLIIFYDEQWHKVEEFINVEVVWKWLHLGNLINPSHEQ